MYVQCMKCALATTECRSNNDRQRGTHVDTLSADKVAELSGTLMATRRHLPAAIKNR